MCGVKNTKHDLLARANSRARQAAVPAPCTGELQEYRDMLYVVFVSACCIGVTLADSGPHLSNDWGESVRLRHLYAARPGLHLQISKDGKIGGSHVQSSHSEYRVLSRTKSGGKAHAPSVFMKTVYMYNAFNSVPNCIYVQP